MERAPSMRPRQSFTPGLTEWVWDLVMAYYERSRCALAGEVKDATAISAKYERNLSLHRTPSMSSRVKGFRMGCDGVLDAMETKLFGLYTRRDENGQFFLFAVDLVSSKLQMTV
ncbi:hypothetical protein RRG08_064869 [Elysia crispata]|uniref:Uncharacterized protein n=1 Tax=Elysia crispata TaxID=231223 RepID=A0AAE0XMD5_9GAST|nr:hypothetical protein RRG08_064869 [Elysia crispata]